MTALAIGSTVAIALICLMEISTTGKGRHKR